MGNKAEIESAVRATHSHTRETMGPLGGGPGSPPLREPLASGQMNHYYLTSSSPDPSSAVTGFPHYLNQSPRSAPRLRESSLSAAEWRECPSWPLPSAVHRRKRSTLPGSPQFPMRTGEAGTDAVSWGPGHLPLRLGSVAGRGRARARQRVRARA